MHIERALAQTGPVTEERKYYYDNNGNTIAEQIASFTGDGEEISQMALSGRSGEAMMKLYTYNGFNQLVGYADGMNYAEYQYNANGLRTKKTLNHEITNFTWNGANLAKEQTEDITSLYNYDVTGIHSADINGSLNIYIKDTHGSVIGVTDDTGVIVNNYEYDAFGVQISGDSAPSPFGYCGEYLDNESGLIYLRNRYYNSETGRFITEDPIKDGMNWYAYCGNNPVTFVDPTGLGFLDILYAWLFPTAFAPGYEAEDNSDIESWDIKIYSREQITTIDDVPVYRVKSTEGTYIEYTTKMNIDADGSPRAYNPNSEKGLDNLGNAGVPGNWWGLATDENGEPVIQDQNDPAPGYYVSTTSLTNPGYSNDDPQRYINSEEVAYIAIPPELKKYGVKLGANVLVFDYSQVLSVGVEAIVADIGPSGQIGEGSIKLADELGIPSNPRTGGVSGNINYRIYIQ